MKLLTVQECEDVPDPPGGRYELHHGALIAVAYPIHSHKKLQTRLRKLLEPMAKARAFIVDTDFPYRPGPENELWSAHVACISEPRYNAIGKWLLGSPELVIEVKVLDCSNAEMADKAMTTLTGSGAAEFWIVDAAARTVTVHRLDSGMQVYDDRHAVPVSLLAGNVPLRELFT